MWGPTVRLVVVVSIASVITHSYSQDVHSLLSTPRHNAGRLPQPSTPSLQPSTPSSVTDPPLRQRTPRNPVATGNRVTVNNGGLYNTPDAGSATTSAGGTAINRTPANHNIPGRGPHSGVVTPSYVNGVVGGHPVTPSANQVTQRRVTSGVQVMRTLEEAGIISRYPPTPTIPRRPSGTGSATTPPVHVAQQDSAQFRTSRLLATLHPTPPGLGVHNAGPHTVVPGSQTPSTVAYAHTVTRHVNAQPTTPQVHGQTATARPHAYTAIPGAHAQTASRRPYVNTINPYGNDRTATPRPHAQTVTLGSQAHITPAINNQRPYTQQRLWTQRPQHNSDTYHTASVNPSITTRSPGRPVFGYATAINSGHANNGAPVTPAANLPRTPGYGSSGGLYISRNPAGNTPTPAYNARAYSMFIRDLNNQLFREYRKWEGKYEDFDDELEGDMELDVTEEEEGDDGAQVFRAVLKKISGTIDQEDELLTLTGSVHDDGEVDWKPLSDDLRNWTMSGYLYRDIDRELWSYKGNVSTTWSRQSFELQPYIVPIDSNGNPIYCPGGGPCGSCGGPCGSCGNPCDPCNNPCPSCNGPCAETKDGGWEIHWLFLLILVGVLAAGGLIFGIVMLAT